MNKEKLSLIITIALFITITGLAIKDLTGKRIGNISEQQTNTGNKPPAEAITACAKKVVGDSCQFMDKDKTSQGTCDNKPGILACAPVKSQPSSENLKESTETKVNSFNITSDAGINNGLLPTEYTCDGLGNSPAISWSRIPEGTKELILMMTTIPVDGNTKWSWILANIPTSATSLAKNSTGVGTVIIPYKTPCSQGSGNHTYTFTLYALSSVPTITKTTNLSGTEITKTISSITLGSASINFNYTRSK
ncbi:MAG: YbhB/YbcL family Raf kinase inhibitor-like protein [Candidatus Roizmanbacteria bacterium]